MGRPNRRSSRLCFSFNLRLTSGAEYSDDDDVDVYDADDDDDDKNSETEMDLRRTATNKTSVERLERYRNITFRNRTSSQ